MYTDMEMWAEIRRRVLNGEMSKRAACEEYEIHWDALTKILSHAEPPGYRSTKPRASKLERFLPVVEAILAGDRKVHQKQRHTAKRIFERVRDEHGYDGGETAVKDAVRACRARDALLCAVQQPRRLVNRTSLTDTEMPAWAGPGPSPFARKAIAIGH